MIWKDIPGLKNYKVNNLGDMVNKKTNYMLKPQENKKGYLRVTITE